jgi:proline iminopeptidase
VAVVTRELSFPIPGPIAETGGPSDGQARLFGLEVRLPETPEDAPIACILHGGPGASHDYLRPQLDALAGPGRRLLYYDQRGSGRSPLPAGWAAGGIAEHLADLRAVLAAVSTGRPVALIGYSWGGLLALHHALDAPETLDRLLLVAPAPPHHQARELMRVRLRAAAERQEVRDFVAGLDRSDRRQRFAGAVAGYFFDPRKALLLTPFVVRERAERGVWDSLSGYDLRPRLPALAVPTCILHGVEDPVPIEGAREIAGLAPRAELVELPGCGHSPYVEVPEIFTTRARAFLDRDLGRPGISG